MWIWKAYLRWRHRKGFGVHSPFAYNLVTTAINPGVYGYYGYDAIDRLLLSSRERGGALRADARLLLRLLIHLGCRRLLLAAAAPALTKAVMAAAAKAAGASTALFKEGRIPKATNGDFLLIDGQETLMTNDELRERLNAGTPVMIAEPTPGQNAMLYASCQRGVIFEGTRLTVAIPREEMAFVAYTMQF